MKLFYYNIKKSNLPYGTSLEPIKLDNCGGVKNELKKYLSENEGKEYILVAVFDQFIDENKTETFMDYFMKYLNLNIFKVHIIDPKRNYILPQALELNVHMNISEKNIMNKVKSYKSKNDENFKVHLVDEYKFSSVRDIDLQ